MACVPRHPKNHCDWAYSERRVCKPSRPLPRPPFSIWTRNAPTNEHIAAAIRPLICSTILRTVSTALSHSCKRRRWVDTNIFRFMYNFFFLPIIFILILNIYFLPEHTKYLYIKNISNWFSVIKILFLECNWRQLVHRWTYEQAYEIEFIILILLFVRTVD